MTKHTRFPHGLEIYIRMGLSLVVTCFEVLKEVSFNIFLQAWGFMICGEEMLPFPGREVRELSRNISILRSSTLALCWTGLPAALVKNLPANAGRYETQVPSLGRKMEEGVVAHSTLLAWRISWAEEPGGLQSMGSQRVRHDWNNLTGTRADKVHGQAGLRLSLYFCLFILLFFFSAFKKCKKDEYHYFSIYCS